VPLGDVPEVIETKCWSGTSKFQGFFASGIFSIFQIALRKEISFNSLICDILFKLFVVQSSQHSPKCWNYLGFVFP